MSWSERIGRLGVWRGVSALDAGLARSIEGLGYGAIWQGGSPSADLLPAEQLLDGTDAIVVATGIVNIWRADPHELARSYHRIAERHPGRLLLGIGSGHREATPQRTRPLQAMAKYLDVLDAEGVPVEDRVLSALGPRMLRLAAERSAGTHPYLTVPAQTREARVALGPEALVAPELTIVWNTDPVAARRTARRFIERYLQMQNYAVTFERAGFGADDFADGGSDALIDAIVRHGDAAWLAGGVRAHLEAGADHVCVQVQPAEDDVLPALAALAEQFRSR